MHNNVTKFTEKVANPALANRTQVTFTQREWKLREQTTCTLRLTLPRRAEDGYVLVLFGAWMLKKGLCVKKSNTNIYPSIRILDFAHITFHIQKKAPVP